MGEEDQNQKKTTGSQPKTKPDKSFLKESRLKKWPGSIFYSTASIIIIFLIILSIRCFEKGFSKNPLLLPGVLFVFVFFDFLNFLINYHIYLSQKRDNIDPLKYYPNFKIWGMGFILGLAVFMFSYFEQLIDILVGKKDTLLKKSEIVLGNDVKLLEYQETSFELIQQVVVILFFLAVIGFILAAIVKIVKDD